MSPTANANNEDQDRAKARLYTRLGLTSGCIVVGALIFGAIVACRAHRTTEALAELAVAVGVIGEVLFHHIAGKAADRLLGRSEARVQELERAREPRVLSLEQIGRLAEKLGQFSGTCFLVSVNPVVREVVDFAENIETAPLGAGWTVLDAPYPGLPRVGKPHLGTRNKNNGVLIGAQSAAPREEVASLIDAGNALVTALTAEGFEASFDFVQAAPQGVNANAMINVLIGPKE